MTSKLYIPNDTGYIVAEKYNDISIKQMTEWKISIITSVYTNFIEADLDIQGGD